MPEACCVLEMRYWGTSSTNWATGFTENELFVAWLPFNDMSRLTISVTGRWAGPHVAG